MPSTGKDGVAHFILMRFNVRTKHRAEARDAAIRSQQDWLESRFSLFEQFCWPTLVAQSCKTFELHVYFDSKTSPSYLERFRDITSGHSFVNIHTCDYFDTDLVITEIKSRLSGRESRILTTRLDNDDGLHRDFVGVLQNSLSAKPREAINFPIGLVVCGKAAYLSRQESNAFISVIEDRTDFGTVLQASHNQIGKLFPIRNAGADAMWLQHVHGGNVSNKTRGRRLTHDALPHGFESVTLSTRIKPIGRTAATIENATAGLLRTGRDLTAKTIRTFGLR